MEKIESCANCAHYDACNSIMKRFTDFGELNKDCLACGYYAVSLEEIIGKTYEIERLRELVEADKDGRVKIYPKSVNSTCGACGHFHRIAGTRRGKCEVKQWATSRYGTPWPNTPFEPSQSRRACKQYEERKEIEEKTEDK